MTGNSGWSPSGPSDLNSPIAGYLKQSQVAVGGLIGKSFGPVILQAYLGGNPFMGAFHHPGPGSHPLPTDAVLRKSEKSFLRFEPDLQSR